MSTASRVRLGGPPFTRDGRITISNGSKAEPIREKVVCESANWIIHLDALAIIPQWRRTNSRVGRQYGTLCTVTMSTNIDIY